MILCPTLPPFRQIPKLNGYAQCEIERFFSQPFFVAERFTGIEGRYVPLKETVRGFREILDGNCDDLPEQAFMMAGTIEDVREKADRIAKGA